MTTPAEIRFELERRLLSLANERGMVPLIMSVHSVVMMADNVVSVGYDITPGDEVLFLNSCGPPWSAARRFAPSASGWRGLATARQCIEVARPAPMGRVAPGRPQLGRITSPSWGL
jgi:hypothetical protein